jgi:hypothetical protein
MGYGKTHSPHPKVNPEKKPQISSLRSAPVEMTILLQRRFRLSPGNPEFYPQTGLSSRPERSVVEKSVVSFLDHLLDVANEFQHSPFQFDDDLQVLSLVKTE